MGILLATFEGSVAVSPSSFSPFTPPITQHSVSAVYKQNVLCSLLGYLPGSEILEAISDNSRSFHPYSFLILPFKFPGAGSFQALIWWCCTCKSILPHRCLKPCSISLLCGERMDPRSQVSVAVSEL